MHDTGHSLVVQVLEIAVNIRLRQKTDRLRKLRFIQCQQRLTFEMQTIRNDS
jgi:hypothetical protein